MWGFACSNLHLLLRGVKKMDASEFLLFSSQCIDLPSCFQQEAVRLCEGSVACMGKVNAFFFSPSSYSTNPFYPFTAPCCMEGVRFEPPPPPPLFLRCSLVSRLWCTGPGWILLFGGFQHNSRPGTKTVITVNLIPIHSLDALINPHHPRLIAANYERIWCL